MNAQDVFDKVVAHLRKQNGKALNEVGLCRYRGIDGNMCAVGCLIADEHYSNDLEGNGSREFRIIEALEKSGIPNTPKINDLLDDMQEVHDGCLVDDWESRFKVVAEEYNLKYEALV